MSEEKSIDELRETLARQILELAIDSDNPQYKLDAYRAVTAKPTPKPAPTEASGGMAAWGARLRQVQRAAEVDSNGGIDEAEADRA